MTRDQKIDEIHEYMEREYCEGGGGLEMLVARFTDKQIDEIHADFVSWFGTIEEIRP